MTSCSLSKSVFGDNRSATEHMDTILSITLSLLLLLFTLTLTHKLGPFWWSFWDGGIFIFSWESVDVLSDYSHAFLVVVCGGTHREVVEWLRMGLLSIKLCISLKGQWFCTLELCRMVIQECLHLPTNVRVRIDSFCLHGSLCASDRESCSGWFGKRVGAASSIRGTPV